MLFEIFTYAAKLLKFAHIYCLLSQCRGVVQVNKKRAMPDMGWLSFMLVQYCLEATLLADTCLLTSELT